MGNHDEQCARLQAALDRRLERQQGLVESLGRDSHRLLRLQSAARRSRRHPNPELGREIVDLQNRMADKDRKAKLLQAEIVEIRGKLASLGC